MTSMQGALNRKAQQSMKAKEAIKQLITTSQSIKIMPLANSTDLEQSTKYQAVALDEQTVFIFGLVSCEQSE